MTPREFKALTDVHIEMNSSNKKEDNKPNAYIDQIPGLM